jgi:hypothetical protein
MCNFSSLLALFYSLRVGQDFDNFISVLSRVLFMIAKAEYLRIGL